MKRATFLHASLLSLALLLASRLLGLLRESLQAAALGATGLADVAIVMLTLPDLLTGILASGALVYVLLPLWATQAPQLQAETRARVARVLLALGLLACALIVTAPQVLVQLMAPGLSGSARSAAGTALWWSAAATPLALLAALWTAHLQHRRDVSGMYVANLVVNGAVVGALLAVALGGVQYWPVLLTLLGAGLLLGMGLRLGWLAWRLQRSPAATPFDPNSAIIWPPSNIWLWALASAGLPLLLPVVGRTLVSTGGEGALTTFNFAWKLIELPLVLAVQLVTALAFPDVARALSNETALGNAQRTRLLEPLRHAFVLAWVLACAAAAALAGMAPALASLLFGWGRMAPAAVAEVGEWGRAGAWSLLPQALLAVLSIVMASTGRLRETAAVYVGALGLLATLGALAVGSTTRSAILDGELVMWSINAALAAAAAALLWRARDLIRDALWIRDFVPAAVAAVVLAVAGTSVPTPGRLSGLVLALGLAALVLLSAWVFSPGLRQALRR